MSYDEIIYDVDGAVASITLNRPKVLNAITSKMLAELDRAVADAGARSEVRAVVLTGAGRAFSAGVDLKALGDRRLDGGSVGPLLDEPARTVIKTIRSIPKPVIAKVNGFCFTGALELVLACDLVLVASDAKLGDTHAKFGLRPTWGMSARLPHVVGMRRAKELSFTARTFSGLDAERYGIANASVSLEDLDGAVAALVEKIVGNSAESIAAYKLLYNSGPDDPSTALEESSTFAISDTEERLAKFR